MWYCDVGQGHIGLGLFFARLIAQAHIFVKQVEQYHLKMLEI